MHRRLLCVAFLGALAGVAFADERPVAKGPAEDGTLPALAAVAGQGLMNSHTYDYLTELNDDIGGRVTGTPAAQKAIEWGLAKMKAIGLENVRAEKWQLRQGWQRVSAEGEIVAPVRRKLHLDSMGWVGSTPAGGAEGQLLPVNIFDLDDELKNTSPWKGKILFITMKGQPRKDPMLIFAQLGEALKAAHKAGAIAVLGGQAGSRSAGMNLTHTGVLGFDTTFDVPVVSITSEDHGLMQRLLERGENVRVRINVQNKLTSGPVESANVVGEIRGTQNPEQVLVVGAHLDSWDLAGGATDNGTGSASVLGAAEAIARSGRKPRRTIRFVLFTGEEQGLLGSFAYYNQHKSEWANHVGDLVLDLGQGPVKEFNLGGRDDLVEAFQPFVNSLRSFGDLKADDKVEFDTDTGPFSLYGLPGINMNQDSPDYKYTHHSAADTVDAVKPEVLAHNAALMAVTAFWIADRPERFASPWPPERTARMLRRQDQYNLLNAFGLWPYKDLGAEEKK